MSRGNQDFHGNDLHGNGKSIFLRELFGRDNGNDIICTGMGISPNSRDILREYTHRDFPEGDIFLLRVTERQYSGTVIGSRPVGKNSTIQLTMHGGIM